MPGSGADTEALILGLILRFLAVGFLAGGVVLMAWDLSAASPLWMLRFGLLGILAAATGYLFWGPRRSLAVLRALEWLVFCAAIGTLLVREQELFLISAGSTDVERMNLASVVFSRMVVQFVLLAMVYAIFVPNTLGRAVPLISICILSPLAGLAMIHNQVSLPTGIRGLDGAGFELVLLGAGGLTALMTAKFTHFLTKTVIEARGKFMYDLIRPIGSGGMGEVWLGRHQMLSRPVAIKWIRPQALLSGDRETARGTIHRFAIEADTTATLRSPHTVEVYDFGVTRGEIFYYSMEYLEGFDLDTLVERFGPVEPGRAVHFLLQACESLAEAHEKDFVHRDIKPANLFATHLGKIYDFVKVLDFGLVKPGQIPSSDAKLTREGTTTGTPAYMAPEMFAGKAELTARVDVYGLGCVAYWLLTGSNVFDETTPLNMAVAHVSKTPLAPSERTELAVPTGLDRIVLRCLEKKPEDRFQTMEELAGALRGLELSASWTPQRAFAWWQRHQPQQIISKTSG